MDLSDAALLALHGVRVLGSPDAAAVARLYGLRDADVREHLLDAEALGLVSRAARPDADPVWWLTDRGRAADEARLAADLDARGARGEVDAACEAFEPLNGRLTAACTRWQLRPVPGDRLAANDHTDHAWDDRVLEDLAAVVRRWQVLSDSLADAAPHLGVHAPRLATALAGAMRGEHGWVAGIDRPSVHLVWIQLHEDLLATSGRQRGGGAAAG